MKPNEAKPTFAWAWAIQDTRGGWLLCQWADPARDAWRMLDKYRPSPEARRVRVRLVPVRRVMEEK
jgi:hypothetical protein